MARFYAGVQGNRSEATRLGSNGSGIRAFVNGWTSGVKVFGHATVSDEDQFTIYATTGSAGDGREIEIATIVDGRVILNSDLVRKQVAGDQTYAGRN